MPVEGELLRIRGGRVIDPANGIDDVRDLWMGGGRVIAAPQNPNVRPARTIDARGYVVMPGGVDVHSHVAGSKVNAARLLRPEEARENPPLSRSATMRSGTLGSVPTSFATGYRYLGLGYTFALDAAIPPFTSRHAHFELRDTPAIDKALLILLGNNHYVMDRIHEGDRGRLRNYIAWLIGATHAYGVKVVNPGGVERWKQGQGNIAAFDDDVPRFGVSPRLILSEVARAVDELALPHAMHVHGLNLGLPGNADSTLELLRLLDGHRAHLAHIQFHSYDGASGDIASMSSGVTRLADCVNRHPRVTVDVGQVMFGETTSMTADGPVGQYLHRVTGRKWLSHDVELETGCGVVPITYHDQHFVHALQWAIGLEWFLLVTDPWKVALSTDHPNGGSFLAYPKIIALLMSKTLRDDMLARLPKKARDRSILRELSREYTLSEIAVITRAGPARILGLRDRGHLAPGAMADATIYQPSDDIETMFALPRWVIKQGQVVVEQAEIRLVPPGETLWLTPEYDNAVVPSIRSWFERESSIAFTNFPISDDEVSHGT